MSRHWPWAHTTGDERQRVLDLLQSAGCPVCREEVDAQAHWIRSYLQETHADEAVARLVVRSRGFCPTHTRQLMADAAAPRLLPTVFADLVERRRADLRGESRGALEPAHAGRAAPAPPPAGPGTAQRVDSGRGLGREVDSWVGARDPRCPVCSSVQRHADDVTAALTNVLADALTGRAPVDASAADPPCGAGAEDEPPAVERPTHAEPTQSVVQVYRDSGGCCLRHAAPVVAGLRRTRHNVSTLFADVAADRLSRLSVEQADGTPDGAPHDPHRPEEGTGGPTGSLVSFLAGVDLSASRRAEDDTSLAAGSEAYELLHANPRGRERDADRGQVLGFGAAEGPPAGGTTGDDPVGDSIDEKAEELDGEAPEPAPAPRAPGGLSRRLLRFFTELGRCPACAVEGFSAHSYLQWLATCDRPLPNRSETVLCTTHLNDLHRQDRPTEAVLRAISRQWRRSLQNDDPAVAVAAHLGLECAACQAAVQGGRFALQVWVTGRETARGERLTRRSHGLCAHHALTAGREARASCAAELDLLHVELDESVQRSRWERRWQNGSDVAGAWLSTPRLLHDA